MTKSLAGKCLLSSPFLEDSTFYKTIIFILQHSENQAFGLILNRPTEHPLKKVVSMVCELKCVHDGSLQFGGPVDGPLIAIHDHQTTGGHPCSDGLYVTSDQDDLRKLFVESSANIKLFDGFSGWAAGQLESELETGSWLVSDITADEVMSHDDLWEVLVKRIGNSILDVGLKEGGGSSKTGGGGTAFVDPSWN